MAGFSDDEVAAAVDRFLLTQVQVPQLKTGARDILTLQSGVYDLLTTALLLRPDSYFYVVYLARNRLLSLITKQLGLLGTIVQAAPNSTRPAKKIASTTDLSSAQAALLDLNAGLNARSTGVRGSIGPAVDRFRRSISSFVGSELTKNVVVGGQVTETGAELRTNIASAWAEATGNHPLIVDLATNFSNALASLGAVRLPEASIRDIVSRIQERLSTVKDALEGDSAIEQSRSAMLDLLTMRTLLTKASGFRNPELVLMPKTGDSLIVTFTDSPGTEAVVEGAISEPFNYDAGTSLSLSLNGGTAVMISLPGSSNAELRSRVFSPWAPPPVGCEAAFQVDLDGTASALTSIWSDGPTAAADLSSVLTPSVTVSWDASTSQLVFRSANTGDESCLRLLVDTVARQFFRDWAFPPAEVVAENKGEPIDIQDVVQAVGSATPLVAASTSEENLTAFTGERTDAPGEEAVIWDRRDSGADLDATAGSVVVTSPSRNFETIGVVKGMALHTTAPTTAEYTVESVDGPTLTLSAAPPPGTLTYYIGPDYRAIPDGSRVRVTSGADHDNSGFYRVAAGGGQVARLVVDRQLQTADDQLAVSVFRRFLHLSAVGTTVSAGIGVGASAGATALGLSPSSEKRPALTRLQLSGGDFLLRGVRVGDLLNLTSPSGVAYAGLTITSVSTADLFIEQTNVPYEPGNWNYEIHSSRAEAFTTAQTGVDAFLAAPYAQDFSKIDALLGRLIRGAKYGGAIESAVTAYLANLSALKSVLEAYSVPRERTIDSVVKTLREQGLDRALDLFLTLEIEELFTMEPDGVSYSTWVMRKAATAGREVVPVSKYAKSDRVVQEWRTQSFQTDPFDPRGGNTQR